MIFEYDDRKWDISPTSNDTNSLFHAMFGLRKGEDELYTDNIAHVRRMNWQNFLSYYENKQRPTFLKHTLQGLFRNHCWSFENDDNFKEYVEYSGQDRQVLLDELPLIAALENIKIILFEGHTGLKIIEPSTEDISDYPLASVRPMETAVVVFKDSCYSKLTPSQSHESVRDGEEEVPKTFRKKHMATGIWYQINLLSIVLLNALDKYDLWRLSSEDRNVSYFDDLILKFGPGDQFLLQAKWKNNKLYSNDFNLAKYFFAYQEVKNNCKVSNVVICTNTSIQFDWLEDFVISRNLNQSDLLYFEGSSSVCHTFKDKIVPVLLEKFKLYHVKEHQHHLITEENLKNFLRDFQIVSLYPTEKSLEQVIENKIVHMGLSDRYDGQDYARHLNMKIREWHDKENVYLTSLHAKNIFCELRTKKLLAKLHNLELALKPEKLHIATSKRISHIISDNDLTLSLLKISKLLGSNKPKTLFLSTSESVRIQKMIAEAFRCEQYFYLIVYKSEPGKNIQELCDIIGQVLSEFSYKNYKKVILIADRHDELAKMLKTHNGGIFEAIEDNVTFTDLTEKCQEQLLERAILFYEASL